LKGGDFGRKVQSRSEFSRRKYFSATGEKNLRPPQKVLAAGRNSGKGELLLVDENHHFAGILAQPKGGKKRKGELSARGQTIDRTFYMDPGEKKKEKGKEEAKGKRGGDLPFEKGEKTSPTVDRRKEKGKKKTPAQKKRGGERPGAIKKKKRVEKSLKRPART